MGRLHRLLIWGTLSAAVIGCAGATTSVPPTNSAPSATADAPTPSPAASAAVVSAKPVCPTAIVGDVDPAKAIVAKANIWNAGHSEPRAAPGGGGAGNMPPVWSLPPGGTRVVTVSDAAGCVTPILGTYPYNGPAGDMKGPTNISAFAGISGIVHRGNGMFLVGVFLTDDEPSVAPAPLDFTDGEDFESIEPQIGQVFFVGDGEGKTFIPPSEATRLFLGFADASLFTGDPGWYGNNAGQVQVTVVITVE
jgi:hypothetical protein